jgi:glycosyltransferase involved in cell wall biosynthesis
LTSFIFRCFRPLAGRTLTTLHGRQDLPDLQPLYFGFKEMPLVSISNSQRAPIQSANFVATVHHGVPLHLHRPTFNPNGGYLAFLGRISPEKGVDRAIKVAQTLGIPLKIAAKVDRTDEVYFHETVNPLLKGPGVRFIGDDEQQKSDFLGQALALMFLIDWPEPFGLSMIEAMACGTPVLALRRGSVEEVVEDGLTGRIINVSKRQPSPCRA